VLVIRREGTKQDHYSTPLQNMRKTATELQKLIFSPQLQINYLIVKAGVASPAAGILFGVTSVKSLPQAFHYKVTISD